MADETPTTTRSTMIAVTSLAGIAAASIAFAIYGGAQPLAFWPIESAADFTQRMAPLFVIALFVERAIEVFVSPWREREEALLKRTRATPVGQLVEAEDQRLAAFKAETKRIAFTAGVSVGIVIAAVGVRALALFIHPAQIEALVGWQRGFFAFVDISMTGLVIGGGADGIHKLVKVFTSLFDATTARNEDRRPSAAPPQV